PLPRRVLRSGSATVSAYPPPARARSRLGIASAYRVVSRSRYDRRVNPARRLLGDHMGTWTIDKPDRLTLDGAVSRLTVNLVAGRLNVVGTDGPARVEVTSIGHQPLR